jgi:hypothetical protein
MMDNPASRKKMRRVDEKKRKRLPFDIFIAIRNAAEPWLRTAMDLALQTTHARLEVSRIKYSIKEPKNGCVDVYGLNNLKIIFMERYIFTGKRCRRKRHHT